MDTIERQKKPFRQRLLEIIEPAQDNKDIVSHIYDYLLVISILLGVIPLMFLKQSETMTLLDKISSAWFLMDYILRWFTADLRSKKKNFWAFLIYPFTIGAIIDLTSLLPTILQFLNPTLKLLRMSRMLKLFRMSRLLRFYEPMQIILKVLKQEAPMLLSVVGLAAMYIFVTALIMFNVESGIETEDGVTMFNNIFDSHLASSQEDTWRNSDESKKKRTTNKNKQHNHD